MPLGFLFSLDVGSVGVCSLSRKVTSLTIVAYVGVASSIVWLKHSWFAWVKGQVSEKFICPYQKETDKQSLCCKINGGESR